MTVRRTSGQESSIDTQLMQFDDQIRLAKFIKDNPVERLRNGFWSQWADKTLSTVSRSLHRIHKMYKNIDRKESNYYPYSRKVT
jgi:hypothetical protein